MKFGQKLEIWTKVRICDKILDEIRDLNWSKITFWMTYLLCP